MEHNYWTYIMASESGVLYIGVTNNIVKRVQDHKNGSFEGFTKKYKCYKLVYVEHFSQIQYAIAREKELKGWVRKKKVNLIESENPLWKDIFDSMI